MITGMIAIVSILFFSIIFIQYNSYGKNQRIQKKIKDVKSDILKVEKDIKEKEEILQKVKEENVEGAKVLEVWEKEYEKLEEKNS